MVEELRQRRELRNADPGVDVGQVELSAGVGDIARAVGQPLDAVKAQRFDAYRFGDVVADEGTALDRRDVLVGVETERHEIADGTHRAPRNREPMTSAASSMTRTPR